MMNRISRGRSRNDILVGQRLGNRGLWDSNEERIIEDKTVGRKPRWK